MANSLIIKTLNPIKRNPKFSQHSHPNPKSKLVSSLPLPTPKSPNPRTHLPRPSHSHLMVKPTKMTTTAAFTLRRWAPIPKRHRCRRPWRCRCRLTGSIVEIIRTFSNLKPMNPNKTVKRIEKIEKEICGVFDLVLIFVCSGCGLCSKFRGLIFG